MNVFEVINHSFIVKLQQFVSDIHNGADIAEEKIDLDHKIHILHSHFIYRLKTEIDIPKEEKKLFNALFKISKEIIFSKTDFSQKITKVTSLLEKISHVDTFKKLEVIKQDYEI